MSLMQELKRRNVIRVAGLYLVGAWLITQVAGMRKASMSELLQRRCAAGANEP